MVSAGSVVAIAVWNVASTAPPGVSLVGESGSPPDIGSIDGGANFLLVGSDSGGGDSRYGKRGEHLNDVTILLHISEDHSRATVVSFPRDMFVAIPACPTGDGGEFPAMSRQKINESLSYGGLACTVLTVSELTGLDIPFAAKIEFNGVIEMANAIGGVEVCVATAIHDRQIGFDPRSGHADAPGLERVPVPARPLRRRRRQRHSAASATRRCSCPRCSARSRRRTPSPTRPSSTVWPWPRGRTWNCPTA